MFIVITGTHLFIYLFFSCLVLIYSISQAPFGKKHMTKMIPERILKSCNEIKGGVAFLGYTGSEHFQPSQKDWG